VPADEPLFTIRGKDEVGPHAIAEYIRIMEMFPDSRLAQEHAASAREALDRIRRWQQENPERVGMGCHTCEHLDHRVRLDLPTVTVTAG
jgi:hypothetical protein